MLGIKYVAYYRVSTARQGQSGLGLDAQRNAVLTFINGDAALIEEFTEVESGKKANRPQLAEAIRACKRHKAVLAIAKLHRLARNVAFIANLMEAGIEFVAVDMPYANRLTVHILAAVAEHEREMISARTKAALQAAKARGIKLGAPNPRKAAIVGATVQRNSAYAFAANINPVIREIQESGGTTLVAVAKALNARGIPTARNGIWHPTSVKNILERSIQTTQRYVTVNEDMMVKAAELA